MLLPLRQLLPASPPSNQHLSQPERLEVPDDAEASVPFLFALNFRHYFIWKYVCQDIGTTSDF